MYIFKSSKSSILSYQLILSYGYILDFSPVSRYRIQGPARLPTVNL